LLSSLLLLLSSLRLLFFLLGLGFLLLRLLLLCRLVIPFGLLGYRHAAIASTTVITRIAVPPSTVTIRRDDIQDGYR
jgi:hypothetical protein